MRRLIKACLWVATQVCLLLSARREAQACSPPPPPRLPLNVQAGRGAPSNLPGFPFSPGYDSTTGAQLDGLELHDGSGARVETSVTPGGPYHLLVPKAPLAPGAYTLVDYSCSSEPRILPVDLRDPAPFPNASGTMRVDIEIARGLGTDCPYSTLDVDFVRARLTVEPDPTLLPWMPLVVDWRLSVDGRPWPHEMVLFALCDQRGEPPPATHGLALGVHHFSATPVVVGAPRELPPIEVDVTLACTTPHPASATNQQENDSDSRSGCATMSLGRSSSTRANAMTALLLVLTGVLARVRRRSLSPWSTRRGP